MPTRPRLFWDAVGRRSCRLPGFVTPPAVPLVASCSPRRPQTSSRRPQFPRRSQFRAAPAIASRSPQFPSRPQFPASPAVSPVAITGQSISNAITAIGNAVLAGRASGWRSGGRHVRAQGGGARAGGGAMRRRPNTALRCRRRSASAGGGARASPTHGANPPVSITNTWSAAPLALVSFLFFPFPRFFRNHDCFFPFLLPYFDAPQKIVSLSLPPSFDAPQKIVSLSLPPSPSLHPHPMVRGEWQAGAGVGTGLGATLPRALQERLSAGEGEWLAQYSQSLGDYMVDAGLDLTVGGINESTQKWLAQYSQALGDYMADAGLDLNVDLLPPKDPYIEVRVLKDAGAMYLDDKVAYLEANTLHLVRKTDAEPLILKVLNGCPFHHPFP
ncbi:unnamed protein product [Closterium sp. NIES-65]|nr:unnamed protein product [Closterium sp. NIES-65]